MTLAKAFSEAEAPLHEAATAATDGLTDFGDADYLIGLRVLLQALDSDTQFSEQGRQMIFGSLVGALSARLRMFKGLKERPECLHTLIRRPLVIIGMPRTGTTALHKLLSMDPQFQGIEYWLGNAPMPRPPRSTWASNPQYQAAVSGLEQAAQIMPEMAAFHEVTADGIDECLVVLAQCFVSNNWGSSYRVPSYDAWWRRQDERPAYRYLANGLRLIGANEPEKPWLLKNPGHIWALDLLLEQFPDACIVQTHRDPVKSIPSVCNLLLSMRRAAQAGTVDLRDIGARELSVWSEAVQRADQVRANYKGTVVDVLHREFHADPIGIVKKIYRQFDFELVPGVEQRMRDWLQANPADKHGLHVYSAEQFGLGAGVIREQFGEYIRRYGL
jgi:hypothetical protein